MNKTTIRKLRKACHIGHAIIALLAIVLCVELAYAVNIPVTQQSSVTYRTLIIRTAEPETLFALTDEETELVCQVVQAEAGGEIYAGQVAVAQCIRNACEKDGLRPAEVFEKYKYTTYREEPTGSVRAAVAAVFRDGDIAIDADILYFYAPARTTSKWHESQIYAGTIGGHRFFCERSESNG